MNRKGVSREHLSNTKTRLFAFQRAFGKLSAALVSAAEIDVWLSGLKVSPRTTYNFRDSLHALWENGIRLGLLEVNPVARTVRPSFHSGAISILTLAEASELLTVARERGTLGYVVLGLFAGLRSSEIIRMAPEDVGDGWVRITKGKTRGSRRVVHLNETALAWLPADPLAHGGDRRRNKLRKAVSFPWPPNGLRHSFASYHLAHFRDLAKLAVEMGSSPGVVRRDYAELVTPQDAAAFWALRPPVPFC
jgi:integrase